MTNQEIDPALQAYFDDVADLQGIDQILSPELEVLPPLERALVYARSQLGIPYRMNVQYPLIGQYHDCSSLTQSAYNLALGLQDSGPKDHFARTTINQGLYWGRFLEESEEPLPGDLYFYRTDSGYFNDSHFPNGVGHVAIYTGNGMAIHSAGDAGMVLEEKLESILASRVMLVGRKRVIEGEVYYHEDQVKPLSQLIGRVE